MASNLPLLMASSSLNSGTVPKEVIPLIEGITVCVWLAVFALIVLIAKFMVEKYW